MMLFVTYHSLAFKNRLVWYDGGLGSAARFCSFCLLVTESKPKHPFIAFSLQSFHQTVN